VNGKLIEHRGVVQRVEGGRAFVAMQTGGCSSCAQGSRCGIGKMAGGRAATLLAFEVGTDMRVGDQVKIVLRESRLALSALFGYLFPALAMLLGAWFGASADGSDGATALGAIAGFFGALLALRVVAGVFPGLMPTPELARLSGPSAVSQQEFNHER
jgi:sigma-E factor negative regulatory protein RseC